MDLKESPNGIATVDATLKSNDKAGLIGNDFQSNSNDSLSNEASPLQKEQARKSATGPGASSGSTSPSNAEQQNDEETARCVKKGQGLRVIVISALVFSLGVTTALILQIYLGPPQVPPHGAVSTSVLQCSKTGRNILQKGGSAVDAAIAAMFCIGVINAHSSGIGGGHFMLVHDHKTGATRTIDARETAPLNVDVSKYVANPKLAESGGGSVAVPGELRGMEVAHKKYGKLTWNELVQPSIEIARNGFTVTKEIADSLERHVKFSDVAANPTLAKHYIRDNNRFVREGDFIRRDDLAGTLSIIATEGVDAFYVGPLADDIVSAVTNDNGAMTADDLVKYKVVEREAIQTKFQDKIIYTLPPPSSGAAMLTMFNIMEGFNVTLSDLTDPLYYHRMIESFKFSYGLRTEIADPAFNSNMKNITDYIISKKTADELRAKISDQSVNKDVKFYETPISRGTSQISVIDNDEVFVSVTSTVNYWFGSKIMTKSGILLNNEMADFSIPGQNSMFGMPPAKANYIEGGKRPLSAMTPTLIHNENHKCGSRLALGGSNGTKILTGIFEVAMNYMLGGESLKTAIDKPRIHNQLYPDIVEYEDGIPANVITFLQQRGHKLEKVTEGINIINAVSKSNETIDAYADARKGGKAVKY
ncbi:glutathione hydrolase 1 proenzyme-like [Tubulanus polymorphus]|uniref:glutathione hydrolase 1 proenzyme-like n=1 Tax=Tubulanus polymorphus TaxID=672921 RepID=UPI003DA5AB7A